MSPILNGTVLILGHQLHRTTYVAAIVVTAALLQGCSTEVSWTLGVTAAAASQAEHLMTTDRRNGLPPLATPNASEANEEPLP